MLLPSYINDDQSSGFGFPFEWYFAPTSKMWLITKGGLFPGYTANIALVPKMNFGCVGLSNSVIGSAVCQLFSDVLLSSIQDYLVKTAPPPPNPGNLSAFEGSYLFQYPGYGNIFFQNVTIYLDPSGEFLLYDTLFDDFSNDVLPLGWVQGNTFQNLPAQKTGSCIDNEMTAYDYITFQTNPQGEVVSFQQEGTDPYWGLYFVKQ